MDLPSTRQQHRPWMVPAQLANPDCHIQHQIELLSACALGSEEFRL